MNNIDNNVEYHFGEKWNKLEPMGTFYFGFSMLIIIFIHLYQIKNYKNQLISFDKIILHISFIVALLLLLLYHYYYSKFWEAFFIVVIAFIINISLLFVFLDKSEYENKN
jgi:hypothetical protein